MRPSVAARKLGISNTRVISLLNDCFDKYAGTLSLPSEETIDKIAARLGKGEEGIKALASEAKVIIGLVPDGSAPGVFIPEPGARQATLVTGETIFLAPDDEEPDKTIKALNAFLSAWHSKPTDAGN